MSTDPFAPVAAPAPSPYLAPQHGAPVPPPYAPSPPGASEKSFLATWLFALLLGSYGVDRFYLGKIGTGVLKLVTLGGFGIWYFLDVVLVLVGSQWDKSGYPLAGRDQHKKVAWIVTVTVFALDAILGLMMVAAVSSAFEAASTSTTGV